MDTLDISKCYPSLDQDTDTTEEICFIRHLIMTKVMVFITSTQPLTVLQILFLPPNEHHLLTGVTDPTIMY